MTKIEKIINAKLPKREGVYDIAIKNGHISSIEPSIEASTEERDADEYTTPVCLNAKNKIVLPGLIEAHSHIDKSFSSVPNKPGTLAGAISAMSEFKKQRSIQTVVNNAERSIQAAISKGVSTLRSHLDLGDEKDLDIIANIVALRDKYKTKIDLEFTVLGSTETSEQVSMMRSAIKLGADMIGGAPSLNSDPLKSIKNAVALAQDLNIGLDLHIDEKQDTEVLALKFLAEVCINKEFQLPVVASHCVSLAYLDEETLSSIVDLLLEANISIISLPICNLTLMGRNERPSTRGIAPIKYLLKKGIQTCVASDNVNDPFNPFGNYDPLLALNTACLAGHMSSEQELENAVDLVTTSPAQIFQYNNYGLEVGAEASMSITDAENTFDCAIKIPERLVCLKSGNLVYQKQIQETWY